ncbi:hypothetical protein AB3662_48110 [Sorangium cellulosum]|uniref:hypothetical protein n=1 Tax=Sorangium cellulosum TaxID=56 RepID=UPI003D9A9DD6
MTSAQDMSDGVSFQMSANGYGAIFRLWRAPLSSEHVDAEIEMYLDASRRDTLVRSSRAFISVKDLRRLASYLDEHIALLMSKPNESSPIFVPLEMGFQIQALSGEVDSSEDGVFSMRLMINVGKSETGENVYVGCEGSIDVEHVRLFIAGIEAALNEL